MFALPAAAAADPIPVEDFAADASIWSPAISPDGKQIAYFAYKDGDDYLVTYRLENDTLTLIGEQKSGDQVDFNWVAWKSSDRLLVSVTTYSKMRYFGSERFPFRRLLSYAKDGSDIKLLLDVRRLKWFRFRFDDVISFLPDDPDHIIIGFSDEGDFQSNAYKINILTGEKELLQKPEKNQYVRDWYADWNGMVRYAYGWDKKKERLMLIRKADGQWISLTKNDLFEDGRFRPLGFSFDERYIYVMSSHVNGRDAVFRFDLESGELAGKVYENDRVDIEGLVVSRAQHKVLAVGYVDDTPKLHYLDEDYRKLHESIDAVLPGRVNQIVSSSADEQYAIIGSSSDRDAGRYYLYDMTQNPRRMVEFGRIYPKLPLEKMARMKPVSYEARDSLTIPAYLTLPEGWSGPGPAVIMPHGGPWVRDTLSFDMWVQFLASRGYAVLQPNYRGSSGYGDRYESLGYGKWGRTMQDDLTDGVKWLVAEGIADPNRVCIVGGSYGGYAALMGAIRTPDTYKCAAAFAPVTDIKRFLRDHGDYVEDSYDYQRVAGSLDKDELEQISPLRRAKEVALPLLLAHGTADDVVPVEHSRELAEKLKGLDKPVKYLEMADENHHMEKSADRLLWFKELEAFLAEHIGTPSAEAAAAAPAQ